jgi:propionyl-CoA carboxylase beta chain
MGPDGAVNIVYRKEILAAADPAATKARFVEEYKAKFASPYKAAELGFIDEVIYPRLLRIRLARGLELLRDKRDKNPAKKHGNIPL